MIIKPTVTELLEILDNRFELVIVTSKRARQGSGKDTIKKELLKRMSNVTTMPSYTDRLPRPGENDGEVYNFVTTEEFEQKIKEDEFYEYSVHHEHYYGTSKKILNEKIKDGKIIVKDIEVNGTENLLKLLKNDLN